MAQQAIVRTRPAPAARPRKPATSARPATAAAAKDEAKDTVKRETRRVSTTAAGQAKQVKRTAATQSKVVARTADQDARALAGTVRSQADQVKGELAGQARELFEETRGQLQSQADQQAYRLARTLFEVGSQAVALSDGRPDQAGPLAEYAEQAANWLDGAASHIEERGLEGLATDVVDFARRRPGVFLAGAAVVGFGVGRLIRSGAVTDGNGNGFAAGDDGWNGEEG
jgi:hypothetical protein